MPLDKESLKAKYKKLAELKEEVKAGNLQKDEVKGEMKKFTRTLDPHGLCDPDIINTTDNLDDVA